MRRERRQHDIVRTYRILPPPLNPRPVNALTSPPTAELFTKLPSKPTNHSKANRKMWSGQAHWVRSNDIASSSYKLLTWRVMSNPGPGSGPVSNLPGLLASLNDNEDKGKEAEVERENGHNSDKEESGGCHDDDESMSFYDVGMMMKMDHVVHNDEEEDGWCLV